MTTDIARQWALPVGQAGLNLEAQFRVCKVQVYNWGRYQDVQRIPIGRKGVAILGPSGGGKSTLLDGISSVIMPNPQEFNRAARDDGGKKSERTVYSYARGLLDQRPDSTGSRGTSARYLRPAALTKGFVSGTAITWEDGLGHRATACRLMWVATDTTDQTTLNNATIYGFVNGDFDLTWLNGLRGVRDGASPLTRTTLEALTGVDTSRGDVFDTAQARIHAKMRDVLGMGQTEDSQRLALQLLRRALASKGVDNINELFRDYVLIKPKALERWVTTQTAYQEASKLFVEYELARTRLEALEGLPDKAERWERATEGHSGKQAILDKEPGGTSRLQLWHAERIHPWCERRIEDIALQLGIIEDELRRATVEQTQANEAIRDINARITAVGGDLTALDQERLRSQEAARNTIDAARGKLTKGLAEFGQCLPASAGDLELLKYVLADLRAGIEKGRIEDEGRFGDAHAEVLRIENLLREAKAELLRLKGSGTNIPRDAAERRLRISQATGIPESALPYAGELMQVALSHRQKWERAVSNLLFPLARRMLVDAADYDRVRRFVYDNPMYGEITLQRVRTGISVASATASGTVADMLEVADGSDFQNWLIAEIAKVANYLPTETLTDMDRQPPQGVRGFFTPNGMRSDSPDRAIKNDIVRRDTWMGWDNTAAKREVEADITSLASEVQAAHAARQGHQRDMNEATARLTRLGNLVRDLVWEVIDLGPVDQRIAEIKAQLNRTASPEFTEFNEQREKAQEDHRLASNRVDKATSEKSVLEAEREGLYDVKGAAWDIIHDEDPLTAEETRLLGDLAFSEPAVAKEVPLTLAAAEATLREQIARHSIDRDNIAETIVQIIKRYRDTDDQFARETTPTIDCLTDLMAAHRQLEVDDLPRTRTRWMEKVNNELNDQLQTLLTHIDRDGRDILRGLDPINSVLDGVPFRNGSTLTIDPVPRPTIQYRQLRDTIQRYTAHKLGQEPDAAEVEKAFASLRNGLGKLEKATESGETWRRKAFDAREHFEFRAIETRNDGTQAVYEGVAGMSGGEGQELIAFILGAALRYRLGEGQDQVPSYGTIILDEGFVKSDGDYTSRALGALVALGFHVVIGAPREKANAFEDHVDSVVYSSTREDDPNRIQVYTMSIAEALDAGFGDHEAA